MQRIEIIDSHTGGEPTRVVIAGAPDLGAGTVAERLERLRSGHDWLRRAVVNEPRGSDVMVGALLLEPVDPTCAAGVIYFDNVTYLGMCGHGTIGLIATLAHMGKIKPGIHRLETVVGVVSVQLHEDGRVTLTNIPSWRKAQGAVIDLPGFGKVQGDIVWGGNWFFIVDDHGQTLEASNTETLTQVAWAYRQAVNQQGHPEVDHIVLVGPSPSQDANARNFVLCPGKAYDRSPCGTGTSAILACLAANGKLAPGEEWVQESIVGSRFVGRYTWEEGSGEGGAGRIIPQITGQAHVTGEGVLLLKPEDPFRHGITS